MADELNNTLPYEGEVEEMEGNKDQKESERESETEDETNFKRRKGSGKINAADPEKQLPGPSLMTASGAGKGKKLNPNFRPNSATGAGDQDISLGQNTAAEQNSMITG